jgi:hypothetical protein
LKNLLGMKQYLICRWASACSILFTLMFVSFLPT